MKPALNVGTHRLYPAIVEPSVVETWPQSQRITYWVIRGLASAIESSTTEIMLSLLLGLRSPAPLRSRIAHLVEKGALTVEQNPAYG